MIFIATWAIFRLYFFFTLVILNSWVNGGENYVFGNPWGFTTFWLLIILQGLHIYWFTLMLRILKTRITGGLVEDIRSDEPPDSKQ